MNRNTEKQPFLANDQKDTEMGGDDHDNKDKTSVPSLVEPTELTEQKEIYLRYFFLVALCFQSTSFALMRRYDFGVLKEEVSDASILIGSELIKLGVSFFITFYAARCGCSVIGAEKAMPLSHIIKLAKTSLKMFVPAFIYYWINILGFIALRRIDAGTFAVMAQLKTFSTAFFSYTILGRKFSYVRVRSLIYLVGSVVVISDFAGKSVKKHRLLLGESITDWSTNTFGEKGEFVLGSLAVITEVTLSGVTSVYYEMVLKNDKKTLSVWDRNIQLAVFSIMLYSPSFISQGYFKGWSIITFLVAVLAALGGILVGFSMKYTDAILKALATSASICFTSILGHLLLKGPYGLPVAVSSISVVLAILTYVTDGKPFWKR